MTIEELGRSGLVLLGCGKMGSALLGGWLAGGLLPGAVTVIEPRPSDWLAGLEQQGVRLNADLPAAPGLCLLAVKPQMMAEAAPQVAALGGGTTVFLSIAAGTPIRALEAILGRDTPTILGILFFSSLLVIVANILTDLTYRLVDPRIKTGADA